MRKPKKNFRPQRGDQPRRHNGRRDQQSRPLISPPAIINSEPALLIIEEDLQTPYTQKLLAQITKMINTGTVKFIFNLEKVNLITSTGFTFLLYALKLSHLAGGEIKLCGLNPQITELIKIAHLDLTFEIFRNEEEAARSFKNQSEILFRQEKRKRMKELLKKSYLDDSTEPVY